MNAPDEISTEGAVDLSEVQRAAAAREAARKAAQEEAIQKQAEAWDRAMTRAFKGVFSRPKRMRFLNDRSYDEQD
jgi:hypothetical protein